jgi:hypothetical protein
VTCSSAAEAPPCSLDSADMNSGGDGCSGATGAGRTGEVEPTLSIMT